MDTNEIVKALRKEVAANPCVGLCSTCNIAECMTKLLIQAADLIEKQERQIQTLKWERDVAVEQAAMEIQELQNSLAVLGQANAALREKVPEWIPVKERPPEPETEVLIVCNRRGCRFVCPAIYEDGKMLTQDSGWNWNDLYDYGTYSEDDDDYFVPQGWWEDRQFTPDDVYNNPVDCEVTHWMPLPELPEEE